MVVERFPEPVEVVEFPSQGGKHIRVIFGEL